jgi:hypothetical protein
MTWKKLLPAVIPVVIPAVILAALAGPGAMAETPRQLAWEDLVPRPGTLDEALSKLTREQLSALAELASIRDRKARGEKLSPADVADDAALSRKLETAGVDVEDLLARRQELTAKRRAQKNAIDPALNGKLVRIPGYLLPLEFSGKKVSEFLLVPWVGACIHTPPPPPNQIVHVTASKPFEMSGVFMPVWVTGEMATGSVKKSLFLVDGSSDIEIGYSVRAAEVEPYKQ